MVALSHSGVKNPKRTGKNNEIHTDAMRQLRDIYTEEYLPQMRPRNPLGASCKVLA